MYRLGLRLALQSGQEAVVRLLVTAAAIAIGVALMLAVLADFNAFKTTNNRPSWESTAGSVVTRNYGAERHAELWNYSNDIYQGQTIERLDVAALGPGTPVPPGITKLPASGQYYASPALAALIRSVPADELGDRFPGRLAGTIGHQALTGPDELVIYVGYAPAQLATLPATTVVSKIATVHARTLWTNFFRDAFVVGAIAFVFPILILVGTATRLAAARREERYAALRLVGATSEQIAVISSVESIVSALTGTLAGMAIFRLLQPALANTSITSARYFAAEVTPTTAGYLAVLIGVPVAAAIASLVSLRRVRISPLGVSRRTTPPAPGAWRLAPLAAGLIFFALGIVQTNTQRIGGPALPALILIMIGLVVAGPWLTAQSARLLHRVSRGAAPLLAARRLADNPRAAFRSVSGLVLAVFLGTVVGGLLPVVDHTEASPSASALSNVLLDGFTSAPVCGDDANCTGAFGVSGNQLAGTSAQLQRIALEGMPPPAGVALLAGLHAIKGTTVIPIYSPAQTGKPHPRHLVEHGPGSGGHGAGGPAKSGQGGATVNGPGQGPELGIISCTGLRELAVLGQCAPGRQAVVVQAASLFDDNPFYSTRPIASASSHPASGDVSSLYLQAVLVKVNGPAALEKARTYLVNHATDSASGTAPRTFAESVQARASIAVTVERLIDIAVVLTLIVAGCSLAVAVGGSLVERKRPFTLLRVSGVSRATLSRVVLLEAVLPLAAATIVAGGLAYVLAVLVVGAIAPAGTPVPVPGHAYFLTMGIGLAASLLVILASLPLLGRITGPANVRFE
jgi:ABC-type antimicrobial peptide transport system permease subunit